MKELKTFRTGAMTIITIMIVIVMTFGIGAAVRYRAYNQSLQNTKKMEVTLNKMMIERLNKEKNIDFINGLK